MRKFLVIFFNVIIFLTGLWSNNNFIGKKTLIINTDTGSYVIGTLKEYEPGKYFIVTTKWKEEITRYWYSDMKIILDSDVKRFEDELKKLNKNFAVSVFWWQKGVGGI